jgi:tRNA threonylcarbamoyladenosine biosynthesis protein TsaB
VPIVPSDTQVRRHPPILALATSGSWCSVALAWRDPHAPEPAPGLAGPQSAGQAAPLAGSLQTACASELAGQAHSQRVLPMARELLEQAGLQMADIGLIAFDAGPGSFTGLRIGCGLAQGLALGLGCPVVPISSLRALAWPHRLVRVLSATDARMSEVYFAQWAPARAGDAAAARLADAALAVGPPAHLSALIQEVARAHEADRLAGTPFANDPSVVPVATGVSGMAGHWVAAGDAFLRYPELAEQARAHGAQVLADVFPRADTIAECAALAWADGRLQRPDEAVPIYVRNKVALDVDEQRALRQARDAAR